MIITQPDFEQTIILPDPDFGDGVNDVHSMNVKYAIDGTPYTTVKSSPRKRFKYSFNLSYAKSREFMEFIWKYLEDEVLIDGVLSIFVSNPVEAAYGINSIVQIEVETLS